MKKDKERQEKEEDNKVRQKEKKEEGEVIGTLRNEAAVLRNVDRMRKPPNSALPKTSKTQMIPVSDLPPEISIAASKNTKDQYGALEDLLGDWIKASPPSPSPRPPSRPLPPPTPIAPRVKKQPKSKVALKRLHD